MLGGFYVCSTVSSPDLHLFMSFTCVFCIQDSVEALLFLWRRRIHRGRFSQAARPLHLGEEHRQPGEDPARHQRRAPAGCCCKITTFYLVILKVNVFNQIIYPSHLLTFIQWHPVRPIIASISSGVVSIWAQNQVVRGQ